jgi:hypothetical protein
MGRMVAAEPSLIGRRSLEPWVCDSIGALLNMKVGSRAMRRVTAPKPFSTQRRVLSHKTHNSAKPTTTRRQSPKLKDT